MIVLLVNKIFGLAAREGSAKGASIGSIGGKSRHRQMIHDSYSTSCPNHLSGLLHHPSPSCYFHPHHQTFTLKLRHMLGALVCRQKGKGFPTSPPLLIERKSPGLTYNRCGCRKTLPSWFVFTRYDCFYYFPCYYACPHQETPSLV